MGKRADIEKLLGRLTAVETLLTMSLIYRGPEALPETIARIDSYTTDNPVVAEELAELKKRLKSALAIQDTMLQSEDE